MEGTHVSIIDVNERWRVTNVVVCKSWIMRTNEERFVSEPTTHKHTVSLSGFEVPGMCVCSSLNDTLSVAINKKRSKHKPNYTAELSE